MICPVCDYDPEAQVNLTDIIVLDCSLLSQNALGSNTRGRSKYRGIRNKYVTLLTKAGTVLPEATTKRRVHITREYGQRKRAYDYGNLVGGCKPLLDAMSRVGLIVDDRPSMLADYYFQKKSSDGTDHITILIEEGDFQ